MNTVAVKRWVPAVVLLAFWTALAAYPNIASAQQAPKQVQKQVQKQASEPMAKPAEPAKAGGSRAILPLEEFLERAMAGHPDIEAAQAKVELAQTELQQTRFRVARELMELRSTCELLSQEVARLEELSRTGHVSIGELAEPRAKLAVMEAQIKTLLRQRPVASNAVDAAARQELECPSGELAQQMQVALVQPVQVDFVDTPLLDALTYLGDSQKHKVKFIVIDDPTSKTHIAADQPITLQLSGVPLATVLEAIEDLTGNVRFVLRDYAIVAAPKDSSLATKAVGAVKQWKNSSYESVESRAAEKK